MVVQKLEGNAGFSSALAGIVGSKSAGELIAEASGAVAQAGSTSASASATTTDASGSASSASASASATATSTSMGDSSAAARVSAESAWTGAALVLGLALGVVGLL